MKPIIVGLNNPYSQRPEHALAPFPERSAGERLWKMYNELDPIYIGAQAAQIDKLRYMNAFDRCNLFGDHFPPGEQARRLIAKRLVATFPKGSTVILLGHKVRLAFNLALSKKIKHILIHPQVIDGLTWRWLPHPSGRSTQYNDPVMKMLAGLTLADVLKNSTVGETDAT